MTPSDISPGFDRLPCIQQAKELAIRSLANTAMLRVSRHLTGMDRAQVEKLDDRLNLLLDVLNGMSEERSKG